jgi:DNA-binding response OmpR family regulator
MMNKVLFIDDERDILELVTIFFADRGFKIDTASSSEEALSLLKKPHAYKLILSDARMPGMKGMELCQYIREHLNFQGHFLLVSGHLENFNSPQLPPGIDQIISKPFDFEDLVSLVIKLIEP